MNVLKNKRGQGIVEYLIMVAMISVGSLVCFKYLNKALTNRFSVVIAAVLGNEPKPTKLKGLPDSHRKNKDMSDFFKGATNTDKD
ncbi:MAG: Flp family type IVb pilin [Bdellovibrionales bacterium]